METVHLFYMFCIKAYAKDSEYHNFRQGSSTILCEYDPTVKHEETLKTIQEGLKTRVYNGYKKILTDSLEKLGKEVVSFEVLIHGVREVDKWNDIGGTFHIAND